MRRSRDVGCGFHRWVRALARAMLLCAAWGGVQAVERRVALVVGNSDYRHTRPLTNPVHDAEDLAGKLRRLGFEVFEGRDLGRDDFYDRLRAFEHALGEAGTTAGLFFYAGHGLQVEGENHLVPVDATLQDEWDLLSKMVRLEDVMKAMKGFSGLKLVFLDACRDNPLAEGLKRSAGGGGARGLAPVRRAEGGGAAGSGMLIMYATQPGNVADDGEGRNSPFTGALLEHIATPGLEVGEMLERVTGAVKERTRNRQVPWRSSAKSGRFYFVSGSGGGVERDSLVTGPAPPLDDGVEQAARAYEAAERVGTMAAYQAVVDAFPGSVYAKLAKAQIKKIERRGEAKREAEKRRQAEEERRRIAGLSGEMVGIAGGCFQMGSPGSEKSQTDDERRHRVCVEDFSIGKYEVTFEQYDRYVEATGARRPDDAGWGRGRRPVIDVSWDDATAYVKWLSGETGEGYRLATEAEWEYAARAGSTTAYPWGDGIGRNRANCGGCGSRWGGKQTAPVGSFPANAWGLYDTLGNVSEWTCSKYDKDYGGAEQRCAAAGSGGRRVFRGGSWLGLPRWVRSAARGRGPPDYRYDDIGFRLVQD